MDKKIFEEDCPKLMDKVFNVWWESVRGGLSYLKLIALIELEKDVSETIAKKIIKESLEAGLVFKTGKKRSKEVKYFLK